MSYSMSPPIPATKPPAPYSPYQNGASPPAQSPYGAPPPAKRPRLSPDARSPTGPNGAPNNYASSPHGLPNQAYGNPYASPGVQPPYSPTTFAGSPQNSFNTPQPYQQQHLPWAVQPTPPQQQQRPPQTSPPPPQSSRDMPPPPKPNKEDEKAGIDEIGDSLYGSGINLKDEESYLHNMWNRPTDSFATNQSTSFGSSTMGSNGSFNMLTQGTSFGSQGQDGPFAGTLGQPRSQEDIDNEVRRKREIASRRRAEEKQYALKVQFLEGNCLRRRMDKLAKDSTVRLDIHGVYVLNEAERKTAVALNGDRTEGIAAANSDVKPESLIEPGTPYEHILSLLCLAANERIRGMVDEAYGLARARKYGDHGRVVPPEFADIATGDGKKSQDTVMPESITGTSWDKSQETLPNGVNGETQTNGSKETPQPAETVSFQGSLNQRLRELAERDRQLEKERIKRREARKQKTESTAGDETTPGGTPAETPAAEAAPSVAPVKMTKKEMNKKQKEAASLDNNSTNQTAALAMGLGGKTKKYSWMTGGATNVPTNRFARPSGGSGTATPKAQPDPPAAKAAKDKEVKAPTWGDWREDSVDGKGIQFRDWVTVLERDGKAKKALEKALNKLQ